MNQSRATYHVTCTQCDLERRMDGLDDVHDLEEVHQNERGESHRFEFELVEESPESPGTPWSRTAANPPRGVTADRSRSARADVPGLMGGRPRRE